MTVRCLFENGLKVEKAHLMRRKGHRITLAHESDFWDALASPGLTA